jgi:multimeric flavodoxin WrbA
VKRILGIVGSPRRQGNTEILVGKILEGAEAAGGAAEMVRLRDLKIAECDGCHACWQGRECPKKDDMNGLYPRISDSDVLVLGTPVYWYGPTALMKGFIDRLVYYNCAENRPKITGKQAVVATPFEEEDPAAAGLLIKFFEQCFRYLKVEFAGKILAGGMKEKGQVLERTDCLREAYELGRQLGTAKMESSQ